MIASAEVASMCALCTLVAFRSDTFNLTEMTDNASKPKSDLSEEIIGHWKNKKSVAYFLVLSAAVAGLVGFGESVSKLAGFATALIRDGATPVVIPNDTGWIFAGYFDDSSGRFIQGPYFVVRHSNYADKQLIPRVGEQITITSERNIVIADFATKGLTRQYEPPWHQNKLEAGDYTGWKLPRGSVVEVRDVSAGSFHDKPSAIWVRVGAIR
jgi:hypothetical protein